MMEHLYSKIAEEQTKIMDKVILGKINNLGRELPSNGTCESLLLLLREFYQRPATKGSIEWLTHKANSIGYSFSIDYLPDYVTYGTSEDGVYKATIDPTKIKLTVTYKVISI